MALCVVCGQAARGLNFGAFSCRACAAFFRRSILNESSYQCRFQGNCKTTQSKESRFSCRACRLKFCLDSGMLPQLVGSQPVVGSDSSDEMEQNTNQLSRSPPDLLSYDIDHYNHEGICEYLTKAITHKFQDTSSTKEAFNFPLMLSQQVIIALEAHVKKWPNLHIDQMEQVFTFDLGHMMKCHYRECENIADFCMSLSSFRKLSITDKWILFKNFFPRFCKTERILTRQRCGAQGRWDLHIHYDGRFIDMKNETIDIIGEIGPTVEEFKQYMLRTFVLFRDRFSIPFDSACPDMFESAYTILLLLWNGSAVKSLSDAGQCLAKAQMEQLADEIHQHYVHHRHEPNYVQRLNTITHLAKALDEVIGTLKENNTISRTFAIFKHDICMVDFDH